MYKMLQCMVVFFLLLLVVIPIKVYAAPKYEILKVTMQGGDTVLLQVEVARTPQAQQRGLMFREDIAKGTGMVFPFDPPELVSFWMKDTLASLDIIFIGMDGRVVNIAAKTTPESLTPIPSKAPVMAVLEIGAGEAHRLGIAVGDAVELLVVTNIDGEV